MIEQVFGYGDWVALVDPITRPRTLPRRDPEARERLRDAARRGAPLVLARERVLAVPDPLGAHLPGGALARGAVVTITGRRGAGVVSTALGLAAAATDAGEWAAAVDPDGTWGGLAAVEAGVDPARFAVVRGGSGGGEAEVPAGQWTTVVAALLDGVSVVVAELPGRFRIRTGDARRLAARARERGAVLALLAADRRAWPAEASLRVQVEGGGWSIGPRGALRPRAVELSVEGRGIRPRRAPAGDPLHLTA
jgi:hypothetical protein